MSARPGRLRALGRRALGDGRDGGDLVAGAVGEHRVVEGGRHRNVGGRALDRETGIEWGAEAGGGRAIAHRRRRLLVGHARHRAIVRPDLALTDQRRLGRGRQRRADAHRRARRARRPQLDAALHRLDRRRGGGRRRGVGRRRVVIRRRRERCSLVEQWPLGDLLLGPVVVRFDGGDGWRRLGIGVGDRDHLVRPGRRDVVHVLADRRRSRRGRGRGRWRGRRHDGRPLDSRRRRVIGAGDPLRRGGRRGVRPHCGIGDARRRHGQPVDGAGRRVGWTWCERRSMNSGRARVVSDCSKPRSIVANGVACTGRSGSTERHSAAAPAAAPRRRRRRRPASAHRRSGAGTATWRPPTDRGRARASRSRSATRVACSRSRTSASDQW